MKTEEIRAAFLRFFEKANHSVQPSSSLVPAGDPTLLFTNAGMVPFKDVFLGTEFRPYQRATTCQKCLRISGKHNDLENVGRTARHHTFFEMLGNFSFGDYFKEEAIEFAWQFITEEVALPKDRLWVTVFQDDDEAAELWAEKTDVAKDRILRCGEKDNFWAMGETGPCGPCSEIFYYLGPDVGAQNEADFRLDDGRYIEIWNLVFMQFNRDLQGNLNPLPKPSVDTGMGLERLAAVIQGVQSNYDSDILRALIAKTEDLSSKKYVGTDYRERSVEEDPQYEIDVAMRVIADHVRAASFLIADGVNPASDGRGYVLRRLVRRACRHGRGLGLNKAFLYLVAGRLIEVMGSSYPELLAAKKKIENILKAEEEKFLVTLDTGLQLLEKEVSAVKERGLRVFPGEAAFALHDTYGFPLDMTEDIVQTQGLSLDQVGFSIAMERQRERSRAARASETTQILQRSVKPISTVFRGHSFTEYESKIIGLFDSSGEIASASFGQEIAVVAEETPFYAEAGGQLGDSGAISGDGASLDVIDTQKVGGDTIVHIVRVVEGEIAKNSPVRLSVDLSRRKRMCLNHSATHLLHLALREILGDHVKQAGSRVSDQSLRFDFNHFEQVRPETLEEIQAMVNQLIRDNYEIVTEVLPREEALKSGAVALFGEKYGEEVRVVQIGPRSREFCGGTHASRSGDIGTLVVYSESAIAAGVRRVEAYAGLGAAEHVGKQAQILRGISTLLKSNESQLVERVERLQEGNKTLERELDRIRGQLSSSKTGDLAEQARTLGNGTKVITGAVDDVSAKELRELADDLRGRVGSGCIALGGINKGKAILLTAVTADLSDRFHAGNIMKEIAPVIGSRGGGNAELAQAGGGDPEKIPAALARFEEIVAS